MVGTAAITEDMLKRRWSANILRYLDKGVTDPAEIAKNEANLSASIMSQRLRTMLRFGLVARFPRPAPSKVVEFRLTPRGKKIHKMLNIIEKLDQLEQQLTFGGKPIEEDLGLPTASPAAVSPDKGKQAGVSPTARKMPPEFSTPSNASLHSMS